MEAMRKQQAAFADFVDMEGLDDDSDPEGDNAAAGKTSANQVQQQDVGGPLELRRALGGYLRA